MTTIIFLVIAAIFIISFIVYCIAVYNELVLLKKNISRNWSNIDVILKQRHDELTKLIDTCKQYMSYEDSTLQAIVKARQTSQVATENKDIKAVGSSEAPLRAGIAALNVRAEAYPDLKANNNFQELLTAIDKLESIIADRREFYNDSVNINNTRLEQFPTNIIAHLFGFKEANLLSFDKTQTADVDVSEVFS